MNWKRNLYILWLTQVLSLMGFGFGLPFLPFYMEKLGVTNPDQLKLYTGIMNVLPALTMAFAAPVWGVLADRYGRKLMILRAMFSASALLALMGLVQNVASLFVLRALQGLFTGTITAASTFVASNTPKDRLSYALGFLSSASFLGSSLGPFFGGITGDLVGFRISFMIGSSLMLAGALIALRFLKEDPDSFGKKEQTEGRHGIKYFLQMVGILLFMIMLQRFVRGIFQPFMPLYLKDIRGPERIASWTGFVNMMIGLATALAGLTLTRLGDRMDKNKVISILLGVGLVLSVGLIFPLGFWSFVLLYTLMFFFLGGVEPLMTSLSAERVESHQRGVLFGYQGMLGSIGFMLAPMVGSWTSIRFGYQYIFYVMIVGLIVNLFFNVIDRKGHHS